jgi:NarL family two-component system response regulator LiaR
MSAKIRLLIADDHEIVREGLISILMLDSNLEVAGEAADGISAIKQAGQLQPDVMLLDLAMPHKDGVAVIREIKQLGLNTRVLVLTSFADDERVFTAIKAGAMGYLLKDTPRIQLVHAIREVAAGRAFLDPSIALKVISELNRSSGLPPTPEPLTAREMETLRLIARGLTNAEIAAKLVIHERTVAKYVGSILAKLQLANRTQAALYALREGLLE